MAYSSSPYSPTNSPPLLASPNVLAECTRRQSRVTPPA